MASDGMSDVVGDRPLRLRSVLDELAAQWAEARRLLHEAVQGMRQLAAARPWERDVGELEEEVEELRRRVAELERERDMLWGELWQLRRRMEEAMTLALPERLAIAREELAALAEEVHWLASAAERIGRGANGSGGGEANGLAR